MVDVSNLKKSFSYTFSRLLTPLTGFIATMVWLLTTIAGPFGTLGVMTLGARGLYWLSIVTGGTLVGFAVFAVVLGVLGPRRPHMVSFLAAVVMTGVFAPYVIMMRSFFASMTPGLYVDPAMITLNTFLFSFGIFVIRSQLSDDVGNMEEPLNEPVAPRLLRRLSSERQAEVLRLEAQDHLIMVVTENGAETVRMRFTDAIEEMEPVHGFCTHRSHWVAYRAVSYAARENAHKVFVVLKNGDRIPVSRKYRPNLDENGFVPSQ